MLQGGKGSSDMSFGGSPSPSGSSEQLASGSGGEPYSPMTPACVRELSSKERNKSFF